MAKADFEGELAIRRPKAGNHISPDEKAAIVQLSAEGNNVEYIADKLGRSYKFVVRHRAMLKRMIEEHQLVLIEDRVEDYTNIIAMALLRMQERLVDDERADAISDKDLFGFLRVAFDKRQLVRNQPTQIHAKDGADPEADGQKKYLDGIALGVDLASKFNEGFEAEQRQVIAARRLELCAGAEAEVIEGEVVDDGDAGETTDIAEAGTD